MIMWESGFNIPYPLKLKTSYMEKEKCVYAYHQFIG